MCRNEYPMHDLLEQRYQEGIHIRAFLRWLRDQKKYVLCEENTDSKIEETWSLVNVSMQELIMEYLEIDLDKLQKETQRKQEKDNA